MKKDTIPKLIILTSAISLLSVGIISAQEVDIFNVPPAISICLKKEPSLSLRGDINPFYITGDFDGDSRLDYAILVRETAAQKRGILICQSGVSHPLVIGAGKNFASQDDLRFDAWYLITRKQASRIISKPLKGDALFLQIKETANGIAYWDGKGFRWKQMAD